MTITALAFYLFSAVMIASGVMVIVSRNPVHAVLFLIVAFLNAAALFVLLGAEFLAMILAIVYVGAVAVLFMFVVMMLDIDFVQVREGFLQYLPIGATIGAILAIELGFVVSATWLGEGGRTLAGPVGFTEGAVTNTEAIGQVLYTEYFYLFQAAGIILLVAMVGAIALTLRRRDDVRRQKVAGQNARRPEEAIEIRRVTPGTGL